ncbi:hypothetical protein [Sinorhizobium meliloti]|uniref:hypothetical protein n=1 Tax=Rhizobium meliloti TaxID=382 RepID=UPI001295A0A5|nr:hypothetical protein [Sinorhizobium meliloti]MQU91734.1 hypothetical protein [Sinorhizobium meliloti]MQV01784.1 hypothetical protein [Sinorhizobium meliloti]
MIKPRVQIILLLALLAGFAVWWVLPRPAPPNPCDSLLPTEARVGVDFDITTEGIKVKFDPGVKRSPASQAALKAWLECQRRPVTLVNGVDFSAQPIGQLADSWKGDSDLRISLIPGADDRVLNNLKIGPAAGTKQEIIGEWCTSNSAACVKCTPDRLTEGTKYVEIELEPNPPAKPQKMAGTWAGSPAGVPLKPWQLVGATGERIFYVCASQ